MVEYFDDAVKVRYIVIIESEKPCFVDVWWSVNLPNNPSEDEILEEFISENCGDVDYEYYCIDKIDKFEIGALKHLYPE